MMNDEEMRMTDEEARQVLRLLLRFWDEGGQELCEALLKEGVDE